MNTGRNDPCPCGSGKKYKKCCGFVVAPNVLSGANNPQRECGECTACCEGWMAATIFGHTMKPGLPCHFLKNGGCSIYQQRPDSPCRNFVCGWRAAESPFPDAFRPTLAKVIVVRILWRERPAFLLCCAGREPDESLLDWMRQFSMATGQPFFYEQNGEKLGFGPPEFQQDMLSRRQGGDAME
jgi:SEC-C motif